MDELGGSESGEQRPSIIHINRANLPEFGRRLTTLVAVFKDTYLPVSIFAVLMSEEQT